MVKDEVKWRPLLLPNQTNYGSPLRYLVFCLRMTVAWVWVSFSHYSHSHKGEGLEKKRVLCWDELNSATLSVRVTRKTRTRVDIRCNIYTYFNFFKPWCNNLLQQLYSIPLLVDFVLLVSSLLMFLFFPAVHQNSTAHNQPETRILTLIWLWLKILWLTRSFIFVCVDINSVGSSIASFSNAKLLISIFSSVVNKWCSVLCYVCSMDK